MVDFLGFQGWFSCFSKLVFRFWRLICLVFT